MGFGFQTPISWQAEMWVLRNAKGVLAYAGYMERASRQQKNNTKHHYILQKRRIFADGTEWYKAAVYSYNRLYYTMFR